MTNGYDGSVVQWGGGSSTPDYFGFTVTATSGTLNLSSLSVTSSSDNVWNSVLVATSLDGFGGTNASNSAIGNLAGTTYFNEWHNPVNGTVTFDLSGQYQGISSIEIRFYVANQEGDGTTFSDINLSGTGAPEHAPWVFWPWAAWPCSRGANK